MDLWILYKGSLIYYCKICRPFYVCMCTSPNDTPHVLSKLARTIMCECRLRIQDFMKGNDSLLTLIWIWDVEIHMSNNVILRYTIGSFCKHLPLIYMHAKATWLPDIHRAPKLPFWSKENIIRDIGALICTLWELAVRSYCTGLGLIIFCVVLFEETW